MTGPAAGGQGSGQRAGAEMDLGGMIRARRGALGLTLDGLAGRSGVSRAMLSEIERGAKNPTIRIVCQIAEGLGMTVSELIGEVPAPANAAPTIVQRGERRTLVDPRSGAERQSLSPAFQARGVEVLWYAIPPGAGTGAFPPHRPGVVEHITVVRGRLRCAIGARAVDLGEGDSIFFAADLPHGFDNPGPEACEYLLIIDSREARE